MTVDKEKAEVIARAFLGQYHNVTYTKASVEYGNWRVVVDTLGESFDVLVDAKTGKILGYAKKKIK